MQVHFRLCRVVQKVKLTFWESIITDENVKGSQGQTDRRIVFSTESIAEYGYNKGSYFWNTYMVDSKAADIELLDLETIGANMKGVSFSFSGSKRTYTQISVFAGFVGVLFEGKGNTLFDDAPIASTGSCFKYGSCFPSVAHNNGRSIDISWIRKAGETENSQHFIDRMKAFVTAGTKFGFNRKRSGKTAPYNSFGADTHDGNHNDHLCLGINEPTLKGNNLIIRNK